MQPQPKLLQITEEPQGPGDSLRRPWFHSLFNRHCVPGGAPGVDVKCWVSPGFDPGCVTCHIKSPSLGLCVHNCKMGRLGLVTLMVLLALRIYEAGS